LDLTVRESNRWCVVERDENPTAAKMRRQILRGEGVFSGFSVLDAPAPAHDDTSFKVCGNEREILFAVALPDSIHFLPQHKQREMTDSAELIFGPLCDRIGWIHFLFNPPSLVGEHMKNDPHRDPELDQEVLVNAHLPYAEAHSSACFDIKLKRHRWSDELFTPCKIMTQSCRWLFAWFRTEELFLKGPACGFNVCRNRPALSEFSTWNYCAGNGSPDASGMGSLHLFDSPACVRDVRAHLAGGRVHVEGCVSRSVRDFSLELADPLDRRTEPPIERDGERWRTSWNADGALSGRWRLYPRCAGGPIEPDYVSVDVPSGARAKDFCVAVTYDPPMSIIPNYYTPERLRRDMETWAGLGVRRIHWIDYGEWPSFWNYRGDWDRNAPRTFAECGNFLAAAADAAHHSGLEFIGDLKTFDLGINCFFVEEDGISTVEDIERRHVSLIPEMAAHPECTMQSNPAWRRAAAFPITRLRIYSETPLPRLRRADVKLLTSKTNARYRRYAKPFRFKQGTLRRPHLRWTPAGTVKDKGGRKNWYVELSGLELTQPFLAVTLGKNEAYLRHRGYMLVEAWSADGSPAPLTVATNGSTSRGFFFWKGWPGWNNATEPILQVRKWDARNLGVVFQESPTMPTVLEPAFEDARKIWLGRVRSILDGGADGVDVRTYCHHNGVMSYLKYIFAAPVRETFRQLYGRDPEARPEDYERIRRIRGEAYTEFMREAKKLTAARGKKLIAELESGIEVPASLDVRMQLPMEWRTWITEGIVDEVRMKWFTAESRFVHEEVLPLARKHEVPVHVISRCLHSGMGVRAVEMARLMVGGACTAGLSGYGFYEHQDMMNLNPEGVPTLKGSVKPYFDEARRTLRHTAD